MQNILQQQTQVPVLWVRAAVDSGRSQELCHLYSPASAILVNLSPSPCLGMCRGSWGAEPCEGICNFPLLLMPGSKNSPCRMYGLGFPFQNNGSFHSCQHPRGHPRLTISTSHPWLPSGVVMYVKECFNCLELNDSDKKGWALMGKDQGGRPASQIPWWESVRDHPSRVKRQMKDSKGSWEFHNC